MGKALACCCSPTPAYPTKRGDRCRKFRCALCMLWQPWCCGAADDTPDLCDACAPSAKRGDHG